MLHVDFLNKNTFRRYPIRTDSTVTSNEGNSLPDSLICAAQFGIPSWLDNIQISRIYVEGNYINILISGINGVTLTHLGYFDGHVTSDFYNLTYSALEPTVHGSMMIGRKDTLQNFQGVNSFGLGILRIEDSLVTFVPTPQTTGLILGNALLTGHVGLAYTNIFQTPNTESLQLDVTTKELVRLTNELSAQYGTCTVNPIGGINGVLPDAEGNIDIYGIDPLKVYVTAIGLRFEVAGVSRADLCSEEKRIPPLVPVSTYMKDIASVTVPEWKTWPQYSKV